MAEEAEVGMKSLTLTPRISDGDEVEEPGKKNILTVRTSDGVEIEVEEEVAREWVVINNMIQDGCADGVIPLPNVSSSILRKVIDYSRKHVQLRPAVAKEAAKAAKAAAVKAAVTAKAAAPNMTPVEMVAANYVKSAADRAAPPRMTATNELNDFDANFVDVDKTTLFDLLEAANYLDIEELLDLTSDTVANMIRGKTPEQIRETFNIVNDYTPEEEAELRKSYQWALED